MPLVSRPWLYFLGGVLFAVIGSCLVVWLHRGYPHLPAKERDEKQERKDRRDARHEEQAEWRFLRLLETFMEQCRMNADDIIANNVEVTLTLNADALIASLSELSAQLPKCPPELIESAVHFFNFPSELVRTEVDPSSTRAPVVAVRLYPADRLLSLLATIRARDLD